MARPDRLRRAVAAMALCPALLWTPPADAEPLRFAQRWEDLSPKQQKKAADNYRQYQKLPEKKRRAIDESYDRWKGMDSSERDRLRQTYDSYRNKGSGSQRSRGR